MIDQLLALPEPQRRDYLSQHIADFNDDAANTLKAHADSALRAELQTALALAELLKEAGAHKPNPYYRALGLRAEANCYAIGLGQYERALAAYDEAAAIYRQHHDTLNEAKAQIGKVWPLAALGHYDASIKLGDWIAQVLKDHQQWQELATITLNIGVIYGRQNNDIKALDYFDQALAQSATLSQGNETGLLAQLNRAEVLRNLGHFQESIEAGTAALEGFRTHGRLFDAARAQQVIGLTLLLQGRLNEALDALERSRAVFQSEHLDEDVATAELQMSDALLQLQRYSEAITHARTAHTGFVQFGARSEQAQCLLNQATGHIGLGQTDAALAALHEAGQLFAQESNLVGLHSSNLEQANVLCRTGHYEDALALAQAARDLFEQHQLRLKAGLADLRVAEAATGLGQHELAERHLAHALQIGQQQGAPALQFSAQAALGDDWLRRAAPAQALLAYEAAITLLERLRGSLMIEHRAEFVADKERVYASAVQTSLQVKRIEHAFELVERAKSRSLLDLLAHRVNLSVQARTQDDERLVEDIRQLQRERGYLINQLESKALRERDTALALPTDTQTRLHVVEQRITEHWHTLLIRNADYARDAALWEVRTEPAQPHLDTHSAIVEYFAVGPDLVVFVLQRDRLWHTVLAGAMSKAQQAQRNLWLNLRAVPASPPAQWARSAQQLQRLSQPLHQLLLAPVLAALAHQDIRRLIFVPHGSLHFLPFHALHDGQRYLIEQFEVSYLPSASVLAYCRPTAASSSAAPATCLAIGHSRQGQLPSTTTEAQAIANLMGGTALLEGQATLAQFAACAGERAIIHIAAHGEFRADAPLFSGIFLEDGVLSALDIFGLRLSASLITLSACETGRNVISGGDELLGLSRAFLSAGAQSLLMSLWRVEDQSTQRLMLKFYSGLQAGHGKAAALRLAQLDLLGEGLHPYFWACFELMGNAG